MSRIRGKNTQPEVYLKKLLRRLGVRFSTQSKKLPGKPDIVLRDRNIAIFIHGCFWHMHDSCKKGRLHKGASGFWKNKQINNRARDRRVQAALKKLGWKNITVWECQLKKSATPILSMLKRCAQISVHKSFSTPPFQYRDFRRKGIKEPLKIS